MRCKRRRLHSLWRCLPGGAVAAHERAVPGTTGGCVSRTARARPFAVHVFSGCWRNPVVGSSPEILVRQQAGKVTVRPIAGTRPRGNTEAEDQALEAELLADPKERAEHLMLIDLGRNDAGRVSTAGSVEVGERFVIERYSHVMHIVSEVTGRLQPGFELCRCAARHFSGRHRQWRPQDSRTQSSGWSRSSATCMPARLAISAGMAMPIPPLPSVPR